MSKMDFTVCMSKPRFDKEVGLLIAIYNQIITNNKNSQKKIPQPIAKVLKDILLPCFAKIWGPFTLGELVVVWTGTVWFANASILICWDGPVCGLFQSWVTALGACFATEESSGFDSVFFEVGWLWGLKNGSRDEALDIKKFIYNKYSMYHRDYSQSTLHCQSSAFRFIKLFDTNS